MDAVKLQSEAADSQQMDQSIDLQTELIPQRSKQDPPAAAVSDPEQRESIWMWVLIFSALQLLFPFVMDWMMKLQSGFSISWIKSSAFWIEVLQWGCILTAGFVIVRWIQKKSGKKDAFWWLVGSGCAAVVLLLGFHEWPKNSLQIIQYLVSFAAPSIMVWLNAAVFLCYGNFLQSGLFLFCSLCSAQIVSGLQSPFLLLVQALLPLVFLMVLSVDLAQEDSEVSHKGAEEEKSISGTDGEFDAEPETVSKRQKLKKYAGRTAALCLTGCFAMILLFGWGLLPWIPTAVATGSMVPAIEIGDLAVVDTRSLEPQVGDIIQFSKQGVSVVHRVIEIQQQDDSLVYITKGDHNENADEEAVYPDEIEGIVCRIVPKLGWLTLWTHAIPSS